MGLFDYLEERQREKRRKKNIEDAGKIAAGLSLGAILGVLFAPQSGEETRRNIGEKAQETKEYLENASKDVADDLQYKAFQASEQVKKTYGNLKEMAAQKKVEFNENVEVAKAKAKAIGEVVREDVKDLKSEAKDAKEALKEGAENIKEDVEKGAKNVKEEVKDVTEEIKKDAKKAKKEIED